VSAGAASAVRSPQTGEQLEPLAVRVQERPALVASLVIVAEISVTGPPAVCEVKLLVMEMAIGGRIWKLKTNICVLSARERAVMVAVWLTGRVAGGV